jgi:hypothetical protein
VVVGNQRFRGFAAAIFRIEVLGQADVSILFLFLFYRQQAVAGKLSQTEHWGTLTPHEQQQVKYYLHLIILMQDLRFSWH